MTNPFDFDRIMTNSFDFDPVKYVKEEYGDHLIGRTIVDVRLMTQDEIDQFGWHSTPFDVPFVVWLDNGTWFIPVRDPEVNGPGDLMIEPSSIK